MRLKNDNVNPDGTIRLKNDTEETEVKAEPKKKRKKKDAEDQRRY